MLVARPENGLLAFALTPFLRRHSDHELPSRPGSAPHPSIRRIAMLGLHHLSRKAARLGIAAGSLAAAAACGDNTIGGPTFDVTLSRIAGFDQLKAALVKARKEHNGGFNLDMWAAVGDRNGLVVAVVFTGATSTDQRPRRGGGRPGTARRSFSLACLRPLRLQPPFREQPRPP